MTTQAKQKYTAEVKENAVKRATESSDVATTARELGMKENTRYNWIYQYSHASKPDKPVRTDEYLYDELKLFNSITSFYYTLAIYENKNGLRAISDFWLID